MMRFQAVVLAVLVVCTPSIQAQVVIVGWGGNTVSQSQDLNGFSSQSTLTAVNINPVSRDNRLAAATDALNNDSVVGIPYSSTTQLSPTANYTGQRFYGGIVAGLTGVTSNVPTLDRAQISNSGNDDVLDFRFQLNSTQHDAHMMVFFQKADFLGGGNVNNVAIGSNSSLSIRFNANTSSQVQNDGEFRWTVRDENGQWWISAKDSTGRPNIRSKGDTGSGGIQNNTTFTDVAANGDLTYWAPYDPSTGSAMLGINFEPAYAAPLTPTAPSYVIDSSTNPFIAKTFDNITALGFYIEGDQFSTNVFQLEIASLSFSASVVPEPAALVMLLGTPALLGSIWYLRRGKRGALPEPEKDAEEPANEPAGPHVSLTT